MGESNGNTVRGNVEFSQDPINSLLGVTKYTLYLNGAGVMTNTKYQVGLGDDCTAIDNNLGDMVTGFYVKGKTNMYNVDGTNGKTMVRGMYVLVADSAGAIIGSTMAALA